MRVKMFYLFFQGGSDLESKINSWLKENEGIEIVGVAQSSSNRSDIEIAVSIFYRPK